MVFHPLSFTPDMPPPASPVPRRIFAPLRGARRAARRGDSLISVLLSVFAILVGFVWFARSQSSAGRASAGLQSNLVAEAYATELLEYFRSQTPDRLKANLATNPISATDAPYPLCAHVNLLDRPDTTAAKTILLNEDPLAALPVPNALDGSDARRAANRFYQVQVVNLKTLAVRKDLCGLTAAQTLLFGRAPTGMETGSFTVDDRFLVTVGVSWVPKDRNADDVKRIALTAVIPTP